MEYVKGDWRCPLMEGSIVSDCSIRGAFPFTLQWLRTTQIDGKVGKVIKILSVPSKAYDKMLHEEYPGILAEHMFEEMLRAYKASRF